MRNKSKTVVLVPVQCKMARIAIGWGIKQLAAAAGSLPEAIVRFERGEESETELVSKIHGALEKAGIEFIPENGSGPGVRVAKVEPAITGSQHALLLTLSDRQWRKVGIGRVNDSAQASEADELVRFGLVETRKHLKNRNVPVYRRTLAGRLVLAKKRVAVRQ
jgi:hypothetical protein